MPWTETRPMQRLDFIRASHAGTDSFSALCRLFGISRKTGYKWLQRFDPSDLSSLSDRSRAPRSHSRTVPDDIAGHLTALRQKHPDWGPKNCGCGCSIITSILPYLPPALSAISSSAKAGSG
ncbi:helix-turn-helix domain-containing protein [Enterobacter kobei]|uniref:helix-turn-helix domain-containing protein n=1 Tax=Enterobacter kobei TaxID=208224 RepID=UPI00388F4318